MQTSRRPNGNCCSTTRARPCRPSSEKKIEFLKLPERSREDHDDIPARRHEPAGGQAAEAAKNAFSDPGLIVTLIVVMGIYVGLWLTPDPSWVTKIAAAALTAAMLAQFAIEDIYGFAVAWSDLPSTAPRRRRRRTQGGRRTFFKRIGPIGLTS